MNKINFLQKKYVLPLIALPFLIFIAYMINQFKPQEEDNKLVEVEEFNAQLQDPTSTSNNTASGKLDALKQRLRREGDFTGIQNVEVEETPDEMIQNSSSLYTTDEMRLIDSINQVNQKRGEELRQEIQKYRSQDFNKKDNEQVEEGNKKPNTQQTQITENGLSPEEEQQRKLEKQIQLLDSISKERGNKARRELRGESETQTVTTSTETTEQPINRYKEQVVEVKRSKEASNPYFNTVGNGDNSLGISAILDEGIKVVQGSRVRIRLLEEVTVGEYRLQPGEYMYGTVTGFTAQRVMIGINSIMVNGKPTKVNLTIYDIDGMEGFYIPRSAFRDYTKEAGSKISNQNITVNAGATGLAQFTYNMLQDIYKSSTQAISKNIRQNKAKLKYATQVYLINKEEEQ